MSYCHDCARHSIEYVLNLTGINFKYNENVVDELFYVNIEPDFNFAINAKDQVISSNKMDPVKYQSLEHMIEIIQGSTL